MDSVYLAFILMLSIFLGFELISKVPSTLHTPLMSGATRYCNGFEGFVSPPEKPVCRAFFKLL